MPDIYAVSVVLANGRQLPTFYLLTDVQGIVNDEHAERIARRMMTDCGHADANVCVAATSMHAHGFQDHHGWQDFLLTVTEDQDPC